MFQSYLDVGHGLLARRDACLTAIEYETELPSQAAELKLPGARPPASLGEWLAGG